MTTRREPPLSDEARPFWDATREQRFVLPWCTTCDAAIWYPRTACPKAAGPEIAPGVTVRSGISEITQWSRPGAAPST